MAERQSSSSVGVEDVEYLRHGDTPLLARLFKPAGEGPHPCLVLIHGGVWCMYDRIRETPMSELLAARGILVVSLDFRMPPDGGYPTSLADINYAVRWVKLHAAELGTRPDLVGVIGVSSGGHQAILGAMRPDDPRYASVPLAGGEEVDARPAFAVLCWPVIDPLGRYHYMQQLQAESRDDGMADNVLPQHDLYWGSEEAMSEGSPVRILERGEKVELPDVLYVQSAVDRAHPRPHLERFVELYRAAGGRVDLELYEDDGGQFARRTIASGAAVLGLDDIVAYVQDRAAATAR